MSTYKRVNGDYNIVSIQATDNVNITTNTVNVAGNIRTSGLTATGTVAFPTANITANNITSNSITSVGNFVTTGVFIGDGSGLTNIPTGNASGNRIQNGTSKVDLPNLSGNIQMDVGGVANVMLLTTTGAILPGNVTTGNILTDNYYFANGVPFVSGGTVKWDAQGTAPSSPTAGDFWFNTVNGIVYQYVDDGDTDQWVDISGVATPPASASTLANTVVQRDVNGSFTANTITVTNLNAAANIAGTYFIGNGSLLTGISTNPSTIINGLSTVTIPSTSGNIFANVNNVNMAQITNLGLAVGNITNLGSNSTGNIGSASNYFNRVFATSTSALYADLAENYTSDNKYEPGTVVIFGGEQEITISSRTHDTAVAGVVSEKPSYLMNSGVDGVAVALTGKVNCKVRGPVDKGTLLTTSDLPGVAERVNDSLYRPGCVLGKSMMTILDNSIQTITIAVGRF
jgi:hypothetical protein